MSVMNARQRERLLVAIGRMLLFQFWDNGNKDTEYSKALEKALEPGKGL